MYLLVATIYLSPRAPERQWKGGKVVRDGADHSVHIVSDSPVSGRVITLQQVLVKASYLDAIVILDLVAQVVHASR